MRVKGGRSRLRWFRMRTCLKKAKLTFRQADDKITLQPLGDAGELLYYYECPFCRWFHMTKRVPNPELTMYQYRRYCELIGDPHELVHNDSDVQGDNVQGNAS
jgi:hypothetical protein